MQSIVQQLTALVLVVFAHSLAGIVGYAEGLIIVNSAMGGLFYHDLSADTTVQIASSSVTGLRGDGLMVDEEHRLYVTHGSLSSATSSAIRVYDLTYNAAVRTVQALLVGTIQSPLLDSPSATADFGKYLVTTNARWDSLPFPAKDEGNLVAFAEQEFSVVVTKKSNLIPVRRRA